MVETQTEQPESRDRYRTVWRMAPGIFGVDGEDKLTLTEDLDWTARQVYEAIEASPNGWTIPAIDKQGDRG